MGWGGCGQAWTFIQTAQQTSATVLIEAAKLAPRWSPELALVYDYILQKGNRNRATLAVARKLAAHFLPGLAVRGLGDGGTNTPEAPSLSVSRLAGEHKLNLL